MSNKNILQNPSAMSFEEEVTLEENETNIQAEGQLQIPTGSFPTQTRRRLSSIRHFLKRRRDILQVSQVWKSLAIPLAMTTWAVNVLIIVVGGIIVFNDLPPTIPLIYDSINNRWEQVDKSVVFIFSIFIGIAEFIAIQYIFPVFRHDRRLALTYAWILVFLNIMLLIAILQIYSLIT